MPSHMVATAKLLPAAPTRLFTRPVTAYRVPGVSPVMVVLKALVVPTVWMKATLAPWGVVPLSAKGLPPAGFNPTRLMSEALQPVMVLLPEQ